MLIAEKCANKSSPPSSGVIKPKPLESLNHLTVPVAIKEGLSIKTHYACETNGKNEFDHEPVLFYNVAVARHWTMRLSTSPLLAQR